MSLKFRIPRYSDKRIVELTHKIVDECKIQGSKLRFIPFKGASVFDTSFDDVQKNPILQKAFKFSDATISEFILLTSNGIKLMNIVRDGEKLFDNVIIAEWTPSQQKPMEVDEYTFFIGTAKKTLKEIKIDEVFSGFPSEEINEYYKARDATLTRLEETTRELLYGIHQRQLELEREYREKGKAGEKKLEKLEDKLREDYLAKEENLNREREALTSKEAEFETKESKYLRRQLRQDILKKLDEHSKKFELTKGTRNLRWPIMMITIVLSVFFAALTAYSFSQTIQLFEAAKDDFTKINWWVVGLLTLKQLAFASATLGGAWFLIKWNDRWFRQHADSEFNYKQLELDINRASWVVEMALEWKEEKGTEIPPELLDRLTRNLFKGISNDGGDSDSPPDVASILLGNASKVKFKAGDSEVEFDRKGIQKALEG